MRNLQVSAGLIFPCKRQIISLFGNHKSHFKFQVKRKGITRKALQLLGFIFSFPCTLMAMDGADPDKNQEASHVSPQITGPNSSRYLLPVQEVDLRDVAALLGVVSGCIKYVTENPKPSFQNWALEDATPGDDWLGNESMGELILGHLEGVDSQLYNIMDPVDVANNWWDLSYQILHSIEGQLAHRNGLSQFIIVPINFRNVHWAAVVIEQNPNNILNPTVYFFDSLGSDAEKLHTIRIVLENTQLFKKPNIIDLSSPGLIQEGTSTCGTWMLQAIKFIIQARKRDLRNNDLRTFVQESLTHTDIKAHHNINLATQRGFNSPIPTAETIVPPMPPLPEEVRPSRVDERLVPEAPPSGEHLFLSPEVIEKEENLYGFAPRVSSISMEGPQYIKLLPNGKADLHLLNTVADFLRACGNIINLEGLKIRSCGFTDQDVRQLIDFKQHSFLKSLNLEKNQLTGKTVSSILHLENLTNLNLSYNPLSFRNPNPGETPWAFPSSLVFLDLSYTGIDDETLYALIEGLRRSPLIRKLFLKGNFITGAHQENYYLSGKINLELEELNLSENKISYQGLKDLSHTGLLSSIYLNLRNNSLTNKSLGLHLMLEESLPEKLKFEHAPAIVKLNDAKYKLIVNKGNKVEYIPVPELEIPTDFLEFLFRKSLPQGQGRAFINWGNPIMADPIMRHIRGNISDISREGYPRDNEGFIDWPERIKKLFLYESRHITIDADKVFKKDLPSLEELDIKSESFSLKDILNVIKKAPLLKIFRVNIRDIDRYLHEKIVYPISREARAFRDFYEKNNAETPSGLLLMSELPENRIPLEGRMYLEKIDNGKIQYKFIDSNKNIIDEIVNINLKEKLTHKTLKSLRFQVLKIILETAHLIKTESEEAFALWPQQVDSRLISLFPEIKYIIKSELDTQIKHIQESLKDIWRDFKEISANLHEIRVANEDFFKSYEQWKIKQEEQSTQIRGLPIGRQDKAILRTAHKYLTGMTNFMIGGAGKVLFSLEDHKENYSEPLMRMEQEVFNLEISAFLINCVRKRHFLYDSDDEIMNAFLVKSSEMRDERRDLEWFIEFTKQRRSN